ncbi:MAG: tetratricopeptide repeat protein [Bacteroidota bacterium]
MQEIRKAFYSKEENRIENAAKLRDFYLDENPDSIYNIGSFLINEGIKKEQLSWLNFGKLIISNYYSKKGKTAICKENLYACLIYYEKKRDYELLADAQNIMGLAFMYDLQNKEAIDWFLKSLNSSQKLDFDNQSFMAQINMAEAFFRLENFDSAEKEAHSFLEKVKKQQLNKGLRKGYDLLARIYFATDRKSEGIKLFEKCLDLAYKNGDKLGLSLAINNIAIAYIEQGDLQKAELYFKKALKLRKEINNPSLICESYYNLGELAYVNSNFDQAIENYSLSRDLAQKFNLIKEQADAVKSIGECYEMKNDFKSAYLNFVDYNEIQEKVIFQIKNDDAKINENYSDFKEKEKSLIQKQREDKLIKRVESAQFTTWIVVILSILICGSIFLATKS